MPLLQWTMNSGTRFEDMIVQTISRYSRHIYRNIRVETLLTKNGTTEIDILFCHLDMVYVVESKNVASLIGDYNDKAWSFIGSKSASQEVRDYSSLNVITQNNIHVRSFKDIFYATFGEWPTVIPIIVVPNDCKVSPDIAGHICTLSQLDEYLVSTSSNSVESKIHRRVAALIPGNGVTLQRDDFVFNPALGKRVKR